MLELAPVWRPEAHQALFRSILEATARPGTIVDLQAYLGADDATLGVLAVFCDATQTVADLPGTLSESTWRFLGARRAEAACARFVVADGLMPPGPLVPALGTLELPDQGATLVVRVRRLGAGRRWQLRGPGIPDARLLGVDGLAEEWIEARARWCADFPLGCDIVLADDTRIAVLPRSTRIARG
jgi:alpha-D-ribose 1-methylphosphonate 5-triphosphate synthase subunit PhnH